MTQRHVIIVV